jgi:hypothetical protein
VIGGSVANGEIPYDEESRPEWNEAVARSATVRVEPDETDPSLILITVDCPRCCHRTAHAEPIVSYRAIDDVNGFDLGIASVLRDALRRAGAEERSRDVSVPCGCRAAHPGAPDGQSGCGAFWSLHVEWGV